MKITIQKDGIGFLAQVDGQENLFAYGETEEETKNELLNVIDMILEYHQEQISIEQSAKEHLLQGKVSYAV